MQKNKEKIVNARIPSDIYNQLHARARLMMVSVSGIIRQALREYFKKGARKK